MSLRGAGQPPRDVAIRFSLQWDRTKSNTLGEYKSGCEFARSRASLPSFPAGKRIAAPVCALVRNDIQKADALLRLQGCFPALLRQCSLAHADTRQVSACHCEERSDAAIRSPCSGAEREAILWANTEKLQICPGDTFLQTLTPARLQHVIARSEATWQSVTPAAAQNKT